MLAQSEHSTAPAPEVAAVHAEEETSAAVPAGASDEEENRSFLQILLRALGAIHT
jgi:hypothetical protein